MTRDFYSVGYPTTLITPARLVERLKLDLTLATTTFQRTGSFKFRAARAVASTTPKNDIITSSSGNFGFARAQACALLGKRCTVVMPANSVRFKGLQ